MERTTSPLQMGHVRRRVVSQGVLERLISIKALTKSEGKHSHALRMELVTTGEAHDPTLSIYILL